MERLDFLKKRYPDLHAEEEVDRSVKTVRRRGDKVPETKDARIHAHFDRLEKVFAKYPKLFTKLFKENLLKQYTLDLSRTDGSEDPEKVSRLVHGLFESEKQILRQRGMGADLEQYSDTLSDDDFEKYRLMLYAKKGEQEKTLSTWVDYLGDQPADVYPLWYRYYVLRSLEKMGKRDRDRAQYTKRSGTSIQSFPDLSREALARVLDAIKARYEPSAKTDETEESEDIRAARKEVEALVDRGDFGKLYAHFQNKIEEARRQTKESIAGSRKHFPKGSNTKSLVKTLEDKGTEWCTAGEDVAGRQLSRGEFYIYYSNNDQGTPENPRVAVYLIDGKIFEVRGVYDKDQNLEPDLVDIAKEKYKQFPGNEEYEQKERDMKRLTAIEKSMNAGAELAKDDLIFLYEVDRLIQQFGFEKDPRIKELRGRRNMREDVALVLNRETAEIAVGKEEITGTSILYIGPLFKNFFKYISDYPNLKDVYTSFPEGKVRELPSLEVSEENLKDGQGFIDEIKRWGMNVWDHAKHILTKGEISYGKNKGKIFDQLMQERREELKTRGKPEMINLVRLTVNDLFGDNRNHTVKEIFGKATDLGLELCPIETGPLLRLAYKDQPLNEYLNIAAEQISVSDGDPRVFGLSHDEDGVGLDDRWAEPGHGWRPGSGVVFRFRKSETLAA